MNKKIFKDEEEMIAFGRLLGEKINIENPNFAEIHLVGDLGAGKTTIARSIIQSLGWEDIVRSPTYTLCEEYDLENFTIFHIDAYRSTDNIDIEIFNLDEDSIKNKLIIIEWPEKLKKKRTYDILLKINHIDQGREIILNDFLINNKKYK